MCIDIDIHEYIWIHVYIYIYIYMYTSICIDYIRLPIDIYIETETLRSIKYVDT